MKYVFKTKDKDEAEIQMEAFNNYSILWELSHNFRRKFKHLNESEEFMKGVEHVLDKLSDELIDFKC